MRILQIKTHAPDVQHPDRELPGVPEPSASAIVNRLNEDNQGWLRYFVVMPDEIVGNIAI